MRRLLSSLAVLVLIFSYQMTVQAQTTGAIAGTIVDTNGSVVPNATVTVKGEGGQEFTATTSSNGTYNIPAVQNGFYTVTITANGFKTSVVSNVKVNVGTPVTVDTALEVGAVGETVEITSGGEVLQTQTATVGANIQGRQIIETPTASRDALDLVALLPGTNSVGAPRRSSINGLPKAALSITIDGVDVQDNLLRSSDGFFTYVRPRVDAIEEVTVSTATGGADTSGDGAVQIKFVTRRGTNDYSGGVYWQHRNTALNTAYWYNNRDLKPLPGDDKAPRNKIILNQYGGKLGGPIPFLGLGEGVPIFNSGKDKRFFFVNYEEFRLPESQSRQRTILTPQAQVGNFSYLVNGQVATPVNLFTIAANNGQLATADPTIAAALARIRSAVGTEGTITPITNAAGALSDPNRQFFNFTPAGMQVRKFLAVRLDANFTKNHSGEFVVNRQRFVPSKDFLNGQEERFPGFPAYAQGSSRNSYAMAVRSTFGTNIVNEARYTISTGLSEFSPGISATDFAYTGGRLLDIGAAGITTPYSRNSYSNRNTPTYDITDSLTWTLNAHNINFGGQYKLIKAESSAINRIVPTISFGVDATETVAFNMFNATSLPGASAAQITEARNLYATLVGRVSQYASNAYLTADGTYQENASQDQLAKQKTYGLFAQDSWRVRPNLTVNFGLRWQPQESFTFETGNYARLENFNQIFGVSGAGNIFRPGTFTGTAPRAVAYQIGEKAYQDDFNNFAPTVGAVWSPDFGESGFLRSIFGASGKSVVRGGYARNFVREGFAQQSTITGNTPGGFLALTRNTSTGNFTVGSNLRDAGNTNITSPSFTTTPAYPLALTAANQALAVDPNLQTGYVDSYSFGYQRELDKNTVVEMRYVGNRGYGGYRLNFVNELNTIENGFASEFIAAQNNLYANIAANRCQTGQQNTNPAGAGYNATCQYNFAYFGAGTGTSPLPISLAYILGPSGGTATLTPGALGSNGTVTGTGAGLTTNYTNALFRNITLVTNLSRNAPTVTGFAGNIENNAARRVNAINAGLPSNFVYVNPTVPAGAFLLDDDARSWYDSAVIEVRRRLSAGLRFQASYVFGRAQSDSFASSSTSQSNYTLRPGGIQLAKNVAVFDVRHAFKFDATYDVPLGKGRAFFGNANGVLNQLVGNFTLFPTVRWQSGSPVSFGNVQLVGMTVKDLQKEVKVRKGPNAVTWLPDDIILNSQRAFSVDITSASGYGTTFGGAPTGRFIAPAAYNNCQSRFSGECGFQNLIIYGPSFFKFDIAVAKKFTFSEKKNIEFRATILDALNAPNFRVGGFAVDTAGSGCCGATFGQLASGSAYQDISTTNDPGGRLIDLMLRINF